MRRTMTGIAVCLGALAVAPPAVASAAPSMSGPPSAMARVIATQFTQAMTMRAAQKGATLDRVTVRCVYGNALDPSHNPTDSYSCMAKYTITMQGVHATAKVAIRVWGPIGQWHTVGSPIIVRAWVS